MLPFPRQEPDTQKEQGSWPLSQSKSAAELRPEPSLLVQSSATDGSSQVWLVAGPGSSTLFMPLPPVLAPEDGPDEGGGWDENLLESLLHLDRDGGGLSVDSKLGILTGLGLCHGLSRLLTEISLHEGLFLGEEWDGFYRSSREPPEMGVGAGGGLGLGRVWLAPQQFQGWVSKPCARRDHRQRGQEPQGPASRPGVMGGR